jgi:hypothetical protein
MRFRGWSGSGSIRSMSIRYAPERRRWPLRSGEAAFGDSGGSSGRLPNASEAAWLADAREPFSTGFDFIEEAAGKVTGTLAQLRQVLDQYPAVWQQLGDLGQQVRETLIRAIAGTDQVHAEVLRREAAHMLQQQREQRFDLTGNGLT